jgi:hypothetical protein
MTGYKSGPAFSLHHYPLLYQSSSSYDGRGGTDIVELLEPFSPPLIRVLHFRTGRLQRCESTEKHHKFSEERGRPVLESGGFGDVVCGGRR